MSEIRGIFGGYWHGEDVVALVIHPDPTSYDPETALEPPFPFGSTVVLRAAPSPVTAAGEGPTKAEIGLVAAALVSAHNASDAVLLAGYAERARMLLVALAGIRAPAPTSAVPGLREAVAECRSRFAAIRDSADKARKRDDTARYQGWVCALDWVLAEIDRRAAGEVEP